MSVTMTLQDEIDTSRGDMIVRENNVSEVGQDLEVLHRNLDEQHLPLMGQTGSIIDAQTNTKDGGKTYSDQ